jgi:hypothetical protein
MTGERRGEGKREELMLRLALLLFFHNWEHLSLVLCIFLKTGIKKKEESKCHHSLTHVITPTI